MELTAKRVYSIKDVYITLAISLFYLGLSYLLIGFKSDQLVLVAIFNGMYHGSVPTRRFIVGFSIFIVYWIIFDYMKAFPNYRYNDVHIADLYHAERGVFGIHTTEGGLLTPNEFLRINSHVFLDILTGLFYLCWVPVPLAFAGYLFFKKREQFLYFSLSFVLVNFLGFIVYYLYPAAPPWYVQFHGFDFNAATPGNTAGLVRFDEYFNINLFKSIYSKGSNVFAAMPSLHSAYPMIVLYYGLKNKLGLINVFFGVVMLGIWFAAVYTSHHYVLDVLAGICVAMLGTGLFNYLLKTKWLSRFIVKMMHLTS